MLLMATRGRSSCRFVQLLILLFLLITIPGFVLADGIPAPDIEKLRLQIEENDWSFTVTDNFSRTITPQQRLNLRSGFAMTDADQREMQQHLKIFPMDKDPLPTSLDWRDLNGITSVKNQGSCGSCWAFAATAELEAFVKIYYGADMDLSEQQSVSCNHYGAGCNGGWAAASYSIFQIEGAVTESCMPYLSMDPPGAPCIQNGLKNYGYITGYNYISNNIEQIKIALQDGPVCTGIDASDAFESYGGGCFDEQSNSTNHLVLIVGYDDRSCEDEGAWIIKNSWGVGFGDGGYIKVKYGAGNTGSGVTQLHYVAPPVSLQWTGGIDGAELMGGHIRDLTWNTSGASVSNVDIWLGIEGHCHDILVAEDIPNNGLFTWEVPNVTTNFGSLVIHPSDGGTAEGFKITQNPIKLIGHQVRYVSSLGSNTAPYETPATAAHNIFDAVNACSGVDTVLVTAGNYVGSSNIRGPFTLLGGFSDDFNTRDPQTYVSRIQSGSTGLYFLSASDNLGSVDGFVFEDCTGGMISDPVGGRHGGAIVVNGCSPTISNCEFNNNLAHFGSGLGYGGAICVIGGEPIIDSCSFLGNGATKGGAIGVFGGAQLSLNQCVFDDNGCSDGLTENVGGAFYVENSTLVMNGGHISGGSIVYQGAALYALDSAIILEDVEFSNNLAANSGGAVMAFNGSFSSSGSLFSGNSCLSGSGGGLNCEGTALNVTNSYFKDNTSLNLGGGLVATNASGKIENSLFRQNTSGSGGGLIVLTSDEFQIRNNIVMDNQGGGLQAAGEFMVANFNNVVDNLPSNYGGGTAGAFDLSLDPLFVDSAAGDFGLGQYSPCVDSGQDDVGCLDPDGSRADMGLLGGPGADFVAPSRVTGAALTDLGAGQVRVTWDSSPEENIVHYVVYRDTAVVFVPTAMRAVAIVEYPATSFEDTPPYDCYYLVVAVDADGYSSGYSQRIYSGDQMTPVGDGMAPRVLSITGVIPNPFNPMATVKFDLPRSGKVQLAVFDLRGRLVRELVSGQMAAGSHEVMWNGRDNRGQMSATGVYFARLSSADGARTVKMVLAK